MKKRIDAHIIKVAYTCLLLTVFLWTSCNITKTVPKGQYLLRENTLKVKSDKLVTRKGELKENLERLIIQKPNYYTGIPLIHIPTKLLLYNLNPSKYEKNTENFQLKSKTVERPVIYDSLSVEKSAQNMRSYLINQGYFYSKVQDTVIFKRKKAYVTYKVNTGTGYLVNKVDYQTGIDDSTIKRIVNDAADKTVFSKGKEFTFSLFDEERERLASLLRNNGYYKFSQENISFELDTANKSFFQNAENPIEGAISFILTQKSKKRPTCDIKVIVTRDDEPDSYKRFGISRVEIYPDYEGYRDIRDSSLLVKELSNVKVKYHNYYVRENVLIKHNYIFPGNYFSEADYDRTINQLSDLGIFQYVRVTLREDTGSSKGNLVCRIEMQRNKQYYFGPSIEFSNGSTYILGSSVGVTFRNINLARGANLLTISANGGVELNDTTKPVGNQFYIQTRYYGLNASLDFPKFIAPFAAHAFTNTNIPHTIIGVGTNVLERVEYFTLINDNINFSYNWHESPTKTWTLSPAFVNIIKLPTVSENFRKRLDTNQFLRNSYKENFIEGENISFTYSDQDKKGSHNFSFVRLSFEEAGALLSGISKFGSSLHDTDFAQYYKFDFDLQHQFTFRHSKIALRLDGGVGIPYGGANTLPYIKQYYVGGPYSLRGWQVRTLGPGSSFDTSGNAFIDRTGDIKLEFMGEYRFDIAQLFAGFIKMNGAIFTDAGNIWLARESQNYPGGNFDIKRLGQDIAADAGAGLRFDIATFITLRLDTAFPIKKPYLSANNGWVIKDVDLSNPNWRANNLVINVAIGYPF